MSRSPRRARSSSRLFAPSFVLHRLSLSLSRCRPFAGLSSRSFFARPVLALQIYHEDTPPDPTPPFLLLLLSFRRHTTDPRPNCTALVLPQRRVSFSRSRPLGLFLSLSLSLSVSPFLSVSLPLSLPVSLAYRRFFVRAKKKLLTAADRAARFRSSPFEPCPASGAITNGRRGVGEWAATRARVRAHYNAKQFPFHQKLFLVGAVPPGARSKDEKVVQGKADRE